MDLETAKKLAKSLAANVGNGPYGCRRLRAEVAGDRVVFTGGAQGEHSLDIGASSVERMLAHWAGYIENNGWRVDVGDVVMFPSASSPSGYRKGVVEAVGPKRVVVSYSFKHGGRAAPKPVSRGDIIAREKTS